MKKDLLKCSVLTLLGATGGSYAADSTNYTDTHGSTATVTGQGSSANYSNHSSMGQSVVVGDSSSSQYRSRMGFFVVQLAKAVPVTDPGVTLVSGQQYVIPVSSDNGDTVGALITTGDAATSFSLGAGNDNGAFSVSNSGAITVADATALSAGTNTLTVSASDGTNPVSDTVTVFVIDNSDLTNDRDTDGIGVADALAQTFGTDDSDRDGIPDSLEVLVGYDINATTDSDGDGTPDVIEILNGRDPQANDNSSAGAPTLAVMSPKVLLNKGILSTYSLSELEVTADDGGTALTPTAYYALGQCQDGVPYNYQAVCTPVAATSYVAGTHKVWWVATDSDHNWAKVQQTLEILPQIGFSGDLTLAGSAGTSSVTTQLVLSGAALNTEAFSIPFTVSGTALNPEDHNLNVGSFIVNPGQTVSEPVTIVLGSTPTDGTVIHLTLDTGAAVFAADDTEIDSSSQFVTVGDNVTQTITISQGQQYPPRLAAFKGSLISTSSSNSTPDIIRGLVFDKSLGDTVTLAFELTDPDGGSYRYNWNASDAALNIMSETTASPTIDISTLEAGQYYVEVMVSDDSAPDSAPAILGAMLTIVEASHLSATQDSDGDGRTDAEEGLGDSDGDGRPDYLDAQNQLANVVPTNDTDQQNYLVKAKPGIRILYGTTAVAANTGDTKISTDNLADYGDKGQSLTDAEPVNAVLAHLFDYEVENMAVPVNPLAEGYTVDIVLPLDVALAADSEFLKYDVASGWRTFTQNTHNQVAWANWQGMTEGICPDPGDATYMADSSVKLGATCLQVTIQDGGPNDADGVVNGRIIDPFGIVNLQKTPVTINTENDGGSGGGGLGPVELFIGFTLASGWLLRRRWKSTVTTDKEMK